MGNLKTCPCCNGSAEVVERSLYRDSLMKVQCTVCQLSTSGTLVNHPSVDPATGFVLENTRYTKQQAAEIELAKWNRRAPCETCSDDKRLAVKVGMILQSEDSR